MKKQRMADVINTAPSLFTTPAAEVEIRLDVNTSLWDFVVRSGGHTHRQGGFERRHRAVLTALLYLAGLT